MDDSPGVEHEIAEERFGRKRKEEDSQIQQSGKPVFVDTFLPDSFASLDLVKSTANDFSCFRAFVLERRRQ
jgi:hypothetical protein